MSEIKYKGYMIKIERDSDYPSPREDDNLGTMVCFHRRYDLGDKHDIKPGDFSGWEQMKDHIQKHFKTAVILPLYLYDHSGITMNTTGFSCPWDSGQVGWIYVTKEKVREEYGSCTKKNLARAEEYLLGEVKMYDHYLTGDVWIYTIEDDRGEDTESCGGYYGEESALVDAKAAVDNMIKKHGEQLSLKLEEVKHE